jgi:hypothetical protein
VQQDMLTRSVLAPYLLAGARVAVLMVPQELRLKFNDEYQKILQNWKQNRSAV